MHDRVLNRSLRIGVEPFDASDNLVEVLNVRANQKTVLMTILAPIDNPADFEPSGLMHFCTGKAFPFEESIGLVIVGRDPMDFVPANLRPLFVLVIFVVEEHLPVLRGGAAHPALREVPDEIFPKLFEVGDVRTCVCEEDELFDVVVPEIVRHIGDCVGNAVR
jgi:hypothetical protein